MIAAILALLLVQEDPFKTLVDPARRSDAAARKAAREGLRAQAKENSLAWAGAKFLEKTEAEWKLAGPALAALQAVLATYGTGTLDEARHRQALQALVGALEKTPGVEPLRLFAYAHAAALGDKAADLLGKLGLTKEGDRWGKRDELGHYAVAQVLRKPGYLAGDTEKAARTSPSFGPRYAVALLDIQKAFSANAGYEPLAKSLSALGGAGAPRSAGEHGKALAESVKSAVYCRGCKAGKITCGPCLGKKRRDVRCANCQGIGWAQKGGAPAGTLIRCWRCPGTGVFRMATCPTCKAKGVVDCTLCGGKPWRDGFKGCRDCPVCDVCRGNRVTEAGCGSCGGKGRVPPTVAGILTMLCAECKGEGVLRNLCHACKESGLGRCSHCGVGPRDGKSPARAKAADVYALEPCEACGGSGWPLPPLAVACDACFGMGGRVKPKEAPDKTLQ